jgi:hypothetical protein
MEYFLLWSEETNRIVIARDIPKGYEVQKQTRASSWIDAKKRFGFELTPLQQRMHDAQNNSHQASGGSVRHEQDAGALIRAAYGELPDGCETLEDTGVCV